MRIFKWSCPKFTWLNLNFCRILSYFLISWVSLACCVLPLPTKIGTESAPAAGISQNIPKESVPTPENLLVTLLEYFQFLQSLAKEDLVMENQIIAKDFAKNSTSINLLKLVLLLSFTQQTEDKTALELLEKNAHLLKSAELPIRVYAEFLRHIIVMRLEHDHKYQIENEALTQKLKQQRKEHQSLQEQQQVLQKENRDFIDKYREIRENYLKSQKNNKKLQDKFQELQKEQRELQERYQLSQKEQQKFQDKYQKLQKQLQELQKHRQTLEEQLETLKNIEKNLNERDRTQPPVEETK